MPEAIIRQGASDVWEVAEMLGAFNEVVAVFRRNGGIVPNAELCKIAEAVVSAAADLPMYRSDGSRDRHALVLKACFQYREDSGI